MKSLKALFFLAASLPCISVQATYIGDSQGKLWHYDETTHSTDYIGQSQIMFDIALNPTSGLLYGITGGGSLYQIDTDDATTQYICKTNAFINGLTFNNQGDLFGAGGNSLYGINPNTASTTSIGSGSYDSSGDISFDDQGNLYLSSTGTSTDSLWLLDALTGIGTKLGSIGVKDIYGLNFANNTLYGFSLSGKTLALDTLTGQGTLISNNNVSAYGADGAGGVMAVNEPDSLMLLMLSLMGIGLLGHKRNSAIT